MKYDRLINNIILGLAIVLAILSLVVGLMIKAELGEIKSSLEEELKAQLTQEIIGSEKNTEARLRTSIVRLYFFFCLST